MFYYFCYRYLIGSYFFVGIFIPNSTEPIERQGGKGVVAPLKRGRWLHNRVEKQTGDVAWFEIGDGISNL